MSDIRFSQWLLEGGEVVLPARLLEKMQVLNLAPEDFGNLALAYFFAQKGRDWQELAGDKSVKWCLGEGWALWQGQGDKRRLSFAPLWDRLYRVWQDNVPENAAAAPAPQEFNYGKILRWLDQVRGTLSVSIREKQVIQELNLKYGWSTDFILIFLQLAFERGHNQLQNYLPIARKAYESGVNTVDGLVSFMNDQDWVQFKAAEVKRGVGQYGSVTPAQREMYLKWNREWKLGHEVIMRAVEETVRTNNPSFKYIDGILRDWREKGVQNISAAEEVLKERDRNKKETPKKADAGRKRTGDVGHRDLNKLLGLD